MLVAWCVGRCMDEGPMAQLVVALVLAVHSWCTLRTSSRNSFGVSAGAGLPDTLVLHFRQAWVEAGEGGLHTTCFGVRLG